ncbi:MAG: protein phosphatase 2C domain-containing protein [Chlamydiota bacterium]|nr:protein phosphatase 2C domain-containing protein [Chlamydiota bacterium]
MKRYENQDHCHAADVMGFYALADGIGGHRGGEIASYLAVNYLKNTLRTFVLKSSMKWDIDHLFLFKQQLIQRTNQHVYRIGRQEPTYSGMGTTLCTLLFHQHHLIHTHIGDSRIYRLRKSTFHRMTEDHSRICHERKRRLLTRALGTQAVVQPELGVVSVSPGDVYLICSDGLTDSVSDSMIRSLLLNSSSNEEKMQQLVRSAMENGSTDDITLILINVG